MIRLIAQAKDGRFVGAKLFDPVKSSADWPREFSAEGIEDDFKLAWLDIESPTSDDLAWLANRFHFHPLAIEDCSHFDQRPKIDEYADHLFLVVHGLKTTPEKFLEIFELHCFLTKKLVVTVHSGKIESLDSLFQRFERNRKELPDQTDFILYKILDSVMDANEPALDGIEQEIEDLDEAVLTRANRTHVEKIHALQQFLNETKRIFAPQRDIFNLIVSGAVADIQERTRVYFRDIYDHSIRLVSLIESLRENVWAIRDTYLAVAANRTNETMKRLTVFSVIFLPLTFITGFFGMNFEHIPWKSVELLGGTLVLVGILPIVMLVWFYRKNWI